MRSGIEVTGDDCHICLFTFAAVMAGGKFQGLGDLVSADGFGAGAFGMAEQATRYQMQVDDAHMAEGGMAGQAFQHAHADYQLLLHIGNPEFMGTGPGDGMA